MTNEDYVNFETAKLLKEKGFNELTYACFSNDGKETYYGYRTVGDDINRPTLQMAMKWLREVHNINPVPYALSLGWAFDVFDLLNRDITGCKKLYSMDFPSKSEVYNTYE